MATWTHFTSYLDGTRSPRRLEIDEVVANFSAALASTPGGTGALRANATVNAEISASNLISYVMALDEIGGSPSPFYVQDIGILLDTSGGFFVDFDALQTASAAAEGLTVAEYLAISAGTVDDYRVWNIYRRIIDGLVPL